MQAQEIDLHLVDLKYAHTRILDHKSIFKMMRSLDRFDQTTPVTVIPESEKYLLIDGYIRVRALAKLHRDTVLAHILDMTEKDALFYFLNHQDQRSGSALEQAWLILEMQTEFDSSLGEISKALGKDKSWVKRRVDLIKSLPGDVLDMVRTGHITPWVASRVLAPLARANPEHAAKLTKHLSHNSFSTRELNDFYKAYQGSTKAVRENMIQNPDLFIKASQHKKDKERARKSLQAPEEAWSRDMNCVCAILRRVRPDTKDLFASLGEGEVRMLLDLLDQAEDLMAQVASKARKGVNNAYATNAGNNLPDAPKEYQYQGDLQALGDSQEHGAQSA